MSVRSGSGSQVPATLIAMHYWLGIQWPLREYESLADSRWIYVQDKHLDVIEKVAIGDRAFIYESLSANPVIETDSGGVETKVRFRKGRGGIVTLVEVVQKVSETEGSRPERSADGKTRWWRYCARTKTLNAAGFLPRSSVVAALGYKSNYSMIGFGIHQSGLGEISAAQYEEMLGPYVQSSERQDREEERRTAGVNRGGGGEGEEHLALKTLIAADPASVLNERGLRTWKVEKLFDTGDRVDIVLKDSLGRIVAVEVEVDCGVSETAGPLQCMKYRAMLSYKYNRSLPEVRTMLVAHSIHQTVMEKCAHHDIEQKIVSRALTAR